MSRTFRRINHPDACHLKELVWVEDDRSDGQYLRWQALVAGTPEHARKRAEFHAESHSGRHSAPGWYCRIYNRTHRAKVNRALRVLADHAFEDLLLEKKPRNAAWHWF